ncbi:hypothetical protein QFZ75_000836 [Streptomyces sp. V3I8]|uniref:hypothetical protein n=1 Tax=Streptomyces sp. V3I8 TaxID=3042279 RepID=UPI002782C2B0|nr:hypothetical protein [Streptomyces sp. V3I8]MDQ1034420.1 hypothetical protein [Streptomyces sp. V3I8]
MSEYGTRTTPEENDGPVPRDLPDQQVQEGEDPWDVVTPPGFEQDEGSGQGEESGGNGKGPEPGARARPDSGASGARVPDTDEAGTGRQGDPGTSTVHPEDPEPQESPA